MLISMINVLYKSSTPLSIRRKVIEELIQKMFSIWILITSTELYSNTVISYISALVGIKQHVEYKKARDKREWRCARQERRLMGKRKRRRVLGMNSGSSQFRVTPQLIVQVLGSQVSSSNRQPLGIAAPTERIRPPSLSPVCHQPVTALTVRTLFIPPLMKDSSRQNVTVLSICTFTDI